MPTFGVDTHIDEFFDEQLDRVLGAPPPGADTGSWYPASGKAVVKGTVMVPDRTGEDKPDALAARSTNG